MMLRSGNKLGERSEDNNAGVETHDNFDAGGRENRDGSHSAAHRPENPDVDHDARSVISTVSKAGSIRMKRLQLEAEETLFEKEKALIMRRLELQQLEIMEEENEIDDSESVVSRHVENVVPVATENRTENWVNGINPDNQNTEVNELIQSMKTAFESLGNNKQDNPSDVKKFIARHAAGKDLPTFTGDPEDWPGFISLYEQSTELCGFSPEENMLRLQRCLKGRAKESVKSILYLPGQIGNVMSTLKMSFGRPSVIIKMMITRAKSIPSCREDRSETIIDFSNAVKNLVATMKNLKCTGNMTNPQLVEELVFKIPAGLRIQWGMIAASKGSDEPNLKDFSQWLEDMAIAASYVSSTSVNTKEPAREKTEGSIKHFTPNPRQPLFATTSEWKPVCTFCELSGHLIHSCEQFIHLDLENRRQWVNNKKACFSCLKIGHSAKDCRRKRTCGLDGCNKHHHQLLHPSERREGKPGRVGSQSALTAPFEGKTRFVAVQSAPKAPHVLLRLLPVRVSGPRGVVDTHALFDEGSTAILMDDKLANEIGLTGVRDPLHLGWTDNSSQIQQDSMRVTVGLQGLNDPDSCLYSVSNVRTVNNLSLPYHSLDINHIRSKWTHLKEIDVSSMTDVEPRVLIGQDNCHLIIPREVIEGPPNAPVLSRSLLGWSIHGNVGSLKQREEICLNAWEQMDHKLHEMIKDSFRVENFGVMIPAKPLLSKEEERAVSIMENTTRRVGDRCETGLLWREENPNLPESYRMAMTRLKSVEKQMTRDKKFAEMYKAIIEEYVTKGYARKLEKHEIIPSPKSWYISHFAVYNVNKLGKIRLVFDAAAESNE